ncbi:hypothetical protein RDWZM_001139 [Blomia tropicalis]|uniref:Uncharacterized protein n=1 Tax=Blomia tropicalis TaxID=40697 RepID=A0A9Q0RQ95_BLOTA|nr:hypothetical protein RDWZM_001139 [Blomia tropicalis]
MRGCKRKCGTEDEKKNSKKRIKSPRGEREKMNCIAVKVFTSAVATMGATYERPRML